jgi:hypothetical protein
MKIDKEILKELHRQQFKRDFHTRGGGCEMVIYVKKVGVRSLELQLWADGRHRVAHFLGPRMSTEPTSFSNADEMRGAIDHELTRTDHPARHP